MTLSSRILLLSADFGSGHLSAAKAIASLCRRLDPQCEAEPLQLKSPTLNLTSGGYLWLIDFLPSIYRKLYQLPVGWPLRALLVTVLGATVQRAIRQRRPHVIVGTHPFPAGVAAYLRSKGKVDVPVVMALTDFLPHGFWVWKGVDLYCVSSEVSAEALVGLGVPRSRIAVTGVAIRPEFCDAATKLARHPSDSSSRRVLVMGGGLGLGPIVEAVTSLASIPQPELRLTVICGTNQSLQQELLDQFGDDHRIEVLGFTNRVAELMAQSDLLVTKPGGITCSEAMALGLPMLLLSPLPGHEEENASYLLQTGAALVTNEGQVGARAAEILFGPPETHQQMRSSARQAGRPRAAEAIANEIFIRSSQNRRQTATVS